MDLPYVDRIAEISTEQHSKYIFLAFVLPFIALVWIRLLFLANRVLAQLLTSHPSPVPAPSASSPPTTPPLIAANHFSDGKPHLLLACTGSVATIKLPNILTALSTHPSLSIRVILSHAATQFLQNQSAEQPSLAQLARIRNVDGIYTDADEWVRPWKRGDPILHIELRRWADVLAVVPLSANGLAGIAEGRSGDLVTSVVRAWDAEGIIDAVRPGIGPGSSWVREGRKRIVVAPAMNTAMWLHPVTARQIRVLEEEWGVEHGGWFEVLRPVEKVLACKDVGSGAMRDWKEIVGVLEERLGLKSTG